MNYKLKTIILSRFKKQNQTEWVKERKKECKKCPFNSKNQEKIKFNKRVLILISNFYSFITGNLSKDNLGNCTACKSCSIYYKVEEPYESCPKGKWEHILEK